LLYRLFAKDPGSERAQRITVTVLPSFSLHRPHTLEEALETISEEDLPYVGGTELLLAMRQGLLRPRSLVDLKRVAELDRVEVLSDAIAVGGAVTHRRLAADPGTAEVLPVVREVLNQVGNPRVQAAGTLAGNLCFAEPKSDVIPLLVALGADVTLTSSDGQRTVDVGSFVVGPYTTVRQPDELLTRISIPVVSDRTCVYLKYQIMERPTVGVAATRSNGLTRVVVGAAGMDIVVVESDNGVIDSAEVAQRLDPIPDLTGSVEYKRHVTSVFVDRALMALAAKESA
jgi:carbon-monoxide dehydrogenase medium subunit